MKKLHPIKKIQTILLSSRHQFGLMLFFSIVLAFILVSISLKMYNDSGTAQIDLSRPGYKDVRNQVKNEDGFADYSEIGDVNKTTIEEMETLINEQIQDIKDADAFAGDPLSPEALGIADVTE